jgi:hypothetical protein
MHTFAFSWLDGKDMFVAGNVATVKVRVLGNFEQKKFEHAFNPNITVNDKLGNSSYVSGVFSHFGSDFNDWRISFIPIMVGLFNVLITDDNFKVFDSSLHFRVTPGFDFIMHSVISSFFMQTHVVAAAKRRCNNGECLSCTFFAGSQYTRNICFA